MHAITRITPPPKGAFLSSAFASGARKPFEYAPSSQVSRSQRLLASIPRGHDRIHVLRRNLYPSQATAGGPVIPRQEAGDPFGLLLRQRIVFLGNQVDDFTADAVISQLLLLDAQDPKKDIKLFINSPGGSVTAGMGIYDAMQMCRADVSTVCMGLAASMGAFLLASGANGKRLSMPNARIMIHQPLGGASGQAVDIEIQAKEIMYHKANLNRLMAFHTGQDVKQVDEDTDRDRYMSPLEAKNYGIIDEIIGGDSAGLQIVGEPKEYLKTKASYISWGDELDGSK